MFIIRMISKLLAIIVIVVISTICLGIRLFEKIGCWIAGATFTFLGVLALGAIISANWISLLILAIIAIAIVVILFGAATVEMFFNHINFLLKSYLTA